MPLTSPIDIRSTPDGVEFAIKAVPNASRSRILGVWNRALRIAVAAPPEAGKANKEIISFLAELLSLRRADITIVAGLANPMKRIRIRGIDLDACAHRIAGALASS